MRRQFNHFYEFGPFRLEVAERRLTNAGTSVPLSPKLFDALLLLVENHGRLLEKDDLIGALWPDSFVEEGNLTHYISQLRKTLGPGADGQALIETVPKRGYRFVAEVREVRAEVSLPQPAGAGLFAAEVDVGARVAQNSANGANEANGIDAEWLDWREPEAEQPLEPTPVATPRRRLVWRWLIAAAVLLAAFTAYRWFTRPAPSARFAAAFQQMRPQKLTSNSSVMHVALSPDGKYLAYVQRDGTQRSLWLKQTSATNGVQLLPPAETAFRGMTFTPDGTQVYYVSYEKGSQIGKLYQIPALGGTPRVVLEDVDSRVTFAPDGKQLCFLRNDLVQHTSAWFIANSDGTQPRTLISYKTPDYLTTEGPAWSPDGQWIAGVAARHGANGPDRKLITVRVADGTAQTLVTRPWPWIGQVAWLPDNAGLVADAWHENALAYTDQIWLFPWPTGAAHLLINDLSRYVGVSVAVDGRALATIQSTRLSRLWVMPVATYDKAAPEKAAALTTGFGDFYSETFGLIWLPDGRLVYGANGGSNTDIWTRRSDGAPPQQLTRDAHVEMMPTASADGRTIVYTAYRDGRPHLWRMDADGSHARQITAGAGEYDPTLSPDGKTVVYVAQDGELTALWQVGLDGGAPVRLFNEAALNPLYSPDGKWLACYFTDPQTRRQQVGVLPVERVHEGRAAARFFAQMPAPQLKLLQWTPDSHALTYGALTNGGGNLWLQPLDGSAPRALTDFKEDMIFRFAWSPDGKSLAYERGTTVNEMVLLR